MRGGGPSGRRWFNLLLVCRERLPGGQEEEREGRSTSATSNFSLKSPRSSPPVNPFPPLFRYRQLLQNESFATEGKQNRQTKMRCANGGKEGYEGALIRGLDAGSPVPMQREARPGAGRGSHRACNRSPVVVVSVRQAGKASRRGPLRGVGVRGGGDEDGARERTWSVT